MANRRFEMFEYRQVLTRMRLGDTDRAIARVGLMGRRKVAQLRRTAEAAGWLDVATPLPGDPELGAHLGSVRTQPAVTSLAEPHRERITRWWRQGVQGTTIHGALVGASSDSLRGGRRAKMERCEHPGTKTNVARFLRVSENEDRVGKFSEERRMRPQRETNPHQVPLVSNDALAIIEPMRNERIRMVLEEAAIQARDTGSGDENLSARDRDRAAMRRRRVLKTIRATTCAYDVATTKDCGTRTETWTLSHKPTLEAKKGAEHWAQAMIKVWNAHGQTDAERDRLLETLSDDIGQGWP